MRINAQKEREAVLKQAYLQAEKILQRAEQKCNQLNDKNEELRRQFYLYKIRFKNFLQSQLEYLESPELKVFEKNDPVLIDTVLEVASTEDEENEKTLNDSDRTVEINHIDEASGLKEDKM